MYNSNKKIKYAHIQYFGLCSIKMFFKNNYVMTEYFFCHFLRRCSPAFFRNILHLKFIITKHCEKRVLLEKIDRNSPIRTITIEANPLFKICSITFDFQDWTSVMAFLSATVKNQIKSSRNYSTFTTVTLINHVLIQKRMIRRISTWSWTINGVFILMKA
jgi:hypothetical protein